MAKKDSRVGIDLKCSECNSINYRTFKSKINTTGKLEVKKYCPNCKKTTIHVEKK